MYPRPILNKPITFSNPIYSNFDPYLVLPDRGPDLKSLPDLSSISWPYSTRPNFTRRSTGKYFDLKLSQGQYNSFKRLLNEFQRVMISLNLQNQWFLSAGSLIGSMRHHDMIPWDDDADVCVDVQYRKLIQSALSNRSSEFAIASQVVRDKLFFKPLDESADVNSNTIGSFRIHGYTWSWPFLDILYFQSTGSHMAKEITWEPIYFDLTKIFPLTYRPFGGHWYPAPRSPIHLLQTYYTNHDCVSAYYSHALEHSIASKSVECERLLNKHPFVVRCPSPAASNRSDGLQLCDEYLVDGNGKPHHKIQTLLPPDEINSLKFTALNVKFVCY
nr:lipopolysaccharide choline [Hymenolepis microstoma]